MISIRSDVTAGTATCHISGELDSFGATALRGEVGRLVGFDSVVLELSGVTFIDSAGLGVLVGAVRRIRLSGSEVAVTAPRPAIARVLHMAGVDRIVDIAEAV